MFKKTVGLNIRGYVLKLGVLFEKLPKTHYIATVEGPEEFAEERFETADAAITWAKSRASWKTGIDGIDRRIRVLWFRGDERGVLEVADVRLVQVVHIDRF